MTSKGALFPISLTVLAQESVIQKYSNAFFEESNHLCEQISQKIFLETLHE
ncbi:hypothetical protein HanXRQr2_Chr17g0824091 [Helianthus annuus]|uniref:Uncharacterized protein n=1 Tax=Helianthus annuus TaxID=4232 RepID=A0A9K3DKP8_HELAN|nr:hypothetical protein HanXRQr2_Chr17g0824091 [Helianthus annuus]